MQRRAIYSDSRHILCLAGAGSGKTRVIVERIAHLIKNGANPTDVFAVTFTVKAAEEMRKRIELLLGYTLENPWIGTFHSLILRMIGEEIKCEVIDEKKQERIWREILGPNQTWVSRVMETVGLLKAENINSFYETGDPLADIIYKSWSVYKQYLKDRNWVDFDDILIIGNELLGQEHIRLKWQIKFKHILIDEFQDINAAQWYFIKKLAGDTLNLFIVGDEDQNIYTWRGSRNQFIQELPNVYKDIEIIKLYENYRSGKEIVSFANNLIVHNEKRFPKDMIAVKDSKSKISIASFEYPCQEAFWLTRKIKEIDDYGNTAVLFRSSFLSRAIEDDLSAERIPYKILNSVKFFKKKEIVDLIAFLTVIYKPSHMPSLKRVLSLFPETDLDLLDKDDLWNFSLPHSFMNLYNQLVSLKGGGLLMRGPNAAEILEIILKQFYSSILETESNFEEKQENVQELIRIADCPLSDFIEKTGMFHVEDEEGVILSTVHSAKGLEFKHVFITGCSESIFPYFKILGDKLNMEEERRIFYVGCTRAEDNLYLSYFEKYNVGQVKSFYRSRFINEGIGKH